MKNFIFKSEADFHKIVFNKLDMVLAEQRHQRIDLDQANRNLVKVINLLKLQKQVDDYFEDKEHEAELVGGYRSNSDSPQDLQDSKEI